MSAGDERPEVDPDAGSAADSVDSIGLDQLEERIHAAAARLRELATDNARLAERVAELEAAAEEARLGASGSEPAAARIADDAGAAEWRREREEVRRRVEKLARRLADLLGDDA